MTAFTYTKPVVGGSEDTWGDTLNANWDALGAFIGGLDSTELAVLDGITATTAELNILDGVTATATELNILDGVTATTAELNILSGVTASAAELNAVDGVTSPIQAQIDGKQAYFGFTPVQQGGGAGQLTNKVYIGWDGGGLKVQVDATDLGRVVFGTGYTDAQARAAQAGHQAGDIGSYAFLRHGSTGYATGSTVAGSTLSYTNAAGDSGLGTATGTWRLMGRTLNSSAGSLSSLWLRIS